MILLDFFTNIIQCNYIKVKAQFYHFDINDKIEPYLIILSLYSSAATSRPTHFEYSPTPKSTHYSHYVI